MEPVIEAHPEYEEAALLERIVEPERVIMFRVPWVDDNGKVQAGPRLPRAVQQRHRPLQGRPALRIHRSTSPSSSSSASSRSSKNSSDRPAHGRRQGRLRLRPQGQVSDGEVMRFCQAFMTELSIVTSARTPTCPAGDIGVGGREIGYLYGQYKQHRATSFDGRAHRQGPDLRRLAGPHRGHRLRPGATSPRGDAEAAKRRPFDGKTRRASPAPATWPSTPREKAQQLGAKVVAVSDSTGCVVRSRRASTVALLKEVKEVRARPHLRVRQPAARREYHRGPRHLGHPLRRGPALRHPERAGSSTDAQALVDERLSWPSREGANMPTTPEATEYLQENGVLFAPGQGVQRRRRGRLRSGDVPELRCGSRWTFEEVDAKLKEIMVNIFHAMPRRRQALRRTRATTSWAPTSPASRRSPTPMMAQGIV